MALKDEIQSMKTIEQGVANNKVVNFAYTDTAYIENDVNGVGIYDFNNENNIPTKDPDVIKVNATVIAKGYRAQASSITRMLVNHIFGRVSYNLNKTVDLFTSLLDKLGNAIGEPNGIATLDVDGRIPYSQLPETAVEYKGEWNAETNTPTLADGTGIKGDMYYVSTDGTQDLGSGDIVFLAGDRIIYNGSIWQKLSGGSVKKVNNIRPDDTGNVTVGLSDIEGTLPFSKGGTGETTGESACNALITSLSDSASTLVDVDCFVAQDTDGGTTNYFKRPLSLLWDYIKTKISSVLGLTESQYNGNANSSQITRAGFVYTCSTSASTKAKTVDIDGFVLETGNKIYVMFSSGNSVSSPTLDVNSTGAKQIRGMGSLALTSQYGSSSAGCYTWSSNTVLELFYDGTYWQVIGNPIVYKMGKSNFLKVHINGYKEGSIQYSFTATSASSPATYTVVETSVAGSDVEKLRLPVMLGFKNTNVDIQRVLSITYQSLSAGTSYSGTRTIVLNLSGGSLAGTQVTCTLNYAGY